MNTTNNVRACTTLYNYLAEYDDPRIGDFYEMTAASDRTEYRAIPYGNRTSSTYSISTTSRAVIGATDPVYYMSAAEAEYLLAECYARLGDKGNAKTHYDSKGARSSVMSILAFIFSISAFRVASSVFTCSYASLLTASRCNKAFWRKTRSSASGI